MGSTPFYGQIIGPQENSATDGETDDIIVVGTRQDRDVTPEVRLVAGQQGGAWPTTYGEIWNGLADKFRALFLQTSVTKSSEFDPKHIAMIDEVIRKVASSQMFKAAYDRQQQQHVSIYVDAVAFPSDIHNRHGETSGANGDGTVTDGASLVIKIAMNFEGVPVSDELFRTTVLHEYIPTLGHPDWTAKLHDETLTPQWDVQLYHSLFSDSLSQSSTPPEFATVSFFDTGNNPISGDTTHGVLVGSVNADLFTSGSSGNIIYAGAGDDQIAVTLGGQSDTIEEEGGSDTLILPAGTALSDVAVAWSPDGRDIGVSVNGHLEAVVVNANAEGAVEWLRIGQSSFDLAALATTFNNTPVGDETVFDILGTYQGYVGTASSFDTEGDAVHYRLSELSGAYTDQNWTVEDNGQIFANFTREDQPGSEFTFLNLIASDGVSASEFRATVHWGSSEDIGPIFGRADTATDGGAMDNFVSFHSVEVPDHYLMIA